MNTYNTIRHVSHVTSFNHLFQIFEESTKLQNLRLERQQQLQRKHLREWKDFAEKYSSDRISLNSEVIGSEFERSSTSTSRVSLGTSLL